MLRAGERSGRTVRRSLARHGIERSGPAFYQMMARLEDAGFVAGEYDQKIVDGQIIKERRYTLTTARRSGLGVDPRVLQRGHRCIRLWKIPQSQTRKDTSAHA